MTALFEMLSGIVVLILLGVGLYTLLKPKVKREIEEWKEK